MNTNYKLIIIAIGLLLALYFGAKAAPGNLDSTFGSGGKVVTPITGYPDYDHELAQTMRVQPDGKIVVCGELSDSFGNNPDLFFLARYHPTGALDTSFGTNGIVPPQNFDCADIALQPDGKIVAVGGRFSQFGIYFVFEVRRYNANGTLDASFGTGGVVISETARGSARSVAIQSDGKIVVAGTISLGFAVIRYNADGSLDTSFGTDGIVTTQIGNDSSADKVILQPDGKIVAVGSLISIVNNTAYFTLTIARYNPDGSLDAGFGAGGTVIHTGFTSYRVGDAALQPDGKIVATGSFLSETTSGTAIVRYNPNGTIDTSFAANGIFTTEENFHVARGIALQSDGKLVAFGSFSVGFAIARLNPNGTWDAGFGNQGRVTTPIGTHTDTGAVDGAVQPDGKIIAFGATFTSIYDSDIAIVRYLGDSAAAPLRANGKIAFTSDRDGNREIYVMSADGSNQVRLTNNNIVDDHPAWSPDGRKIAFLSQSASGSFAIFVMNADGTGKTEITPVNYLSPSPWRGYDEWSMSWSPDGNHIAFSEGGANASTLIVVNADGSNRRSITPGIYPAWSPDGSKILFLGVIGIGNISFNLLTIRPDGTDLRNITPSFPNFYTLFDSPPIWSPDGRKIAYSATDFANSEIYIANPDGSNPQAFVHICGEFVPNGCGFNTALPAWSPNGETIAFATWSFGDRSGTEIYVKNIGENAVTRLTNTTGSNSNPNWQPLAKAMTDFDGDGRADISVFRSSDRIWYLNQSTNGFSATQFGLSTDKITPADFDGDGKTDISVFRDGTWYWLNSSNGNFNAVQFGIEDDVPIPADFTGDGRAELAVYRGGFWYTLNLANNQFNAVRFGLSTDKPVAADYDGDGRADYAVYRDGIWYLLQSTQGFAAMQFGIAADKLVPADYDGDGKTDLAVYRDGVWYLQQSTQGFTAFQFGVASDTPAPADYDGDGRMDAAVFRDGVWYLRQSASGFAAVSFGLTNDKPVPSAYVP